LHGWVWSATCRVCDGVGGFLCVATCAAACVFDRQEGVYTRSIPPIAPHHGSRTVPEYFVPGFRSNDGWMGNAFAVGFAGECRA
jgi:hypothetical protein